MMKLRSAFQSRNRCSWTRCEVGEKKIYLCCSPSRLFYLRLQVFHMQSLGCSAQGHSKCEVSVFQTKHEGKKERI